MLDPTVQQFTSAGSQTLVVQALQTPKLEIQIRTHSWAFPQRDAPVMLDRWFLDLSLSARPGPPRGRYVEMWRGGRTEPIGDVLVVAPQLEFRATHGAGRQASLSLFLHSDLLSLGPDDLDEARLAEGLHVRDQAIRRSLWRLAAEARSPSLQSAGLMETAVIAIAHKVGRRLARATGNEGLKRGGLGPARLRTVEDRIRSSLTPPTVSELAVLCGLSERQLARAFRPETGESIGVRVGVATLQRAWALLTETDRPIRRIAEDLGYSPASFAAAFKASTGRRPSEVRGSAREPTT